MNFEQDRIYGNPAGYLYKKTQRIIDKAKEIIEGTDHPMTIRQIFYQLVAQNFFPNTPQQYRQLSYHLVTARQRGLISWDAIEDRTRIPFEVSMWDDIESFVDSALASFRLDVWEEQPIYIECWLEKSALSAVFLPILRPYGITLNVGRGFDAWSSIYQAACRLNTHEQPITILYFGDFDPSGEEMAISLTERLSFFGCEPDLIKCAIKKEDIERYNLPPQMAKKRDSRTAKFIEKYGNACVELDALPVAVLAERIRSAIDSRIDPEALKKVLNRQKRQSTKLKNALSGSWK